MTKCYYCDGVPGRHFGGCPVPEITVSPTPIVEDAGPEEVTEEWPPFEVRPPADVPDEWLYPDG